MKLQFVVTHTIRDNRNTRITRRLGYKHTFCQNFVSTKKNCLNVYFCKNLKCLSIGLLTIGEVFFFVSPGTFFIDGYDKLLLHAPINP